MSLQQFRASQRGFFQKQKGEMIQRWEIARFISFNVLAPYAKKGRLSSPQDLIRFEWETKPEEMDRDEVMKQIKKMGMFVDKHGNYHN